MLWLFLILLLVGLVVIAIMATLSVNNVNRAFTEGQAEGIRQMAEEAVQRGYGEWVLYCDHADGHAKPGTKFNWICTTIVKKEGE